MRYLWSRWLVIFLLLEIILFLYYYYARTDSLQSLYSLEQITKQTLQQIEFLTFDNQRLEDQIKLWQQDYFWQEKFVRERLSLQKQGETIYFR